MLVFRLSPKEKGAETLSGSDNLLSQSATGSRSDTKLTRDDGKQHLPDEACRCDPPHSHFTQSLVDGRERCGGGQSEALDRDGGKEYSEAPT